MPIKQTKSTLYEVEIPYGNVEIGNKDSVDFKPHLKLSRWDECTLELDLATNEKIAPTLDNEKITWSGKDFGAEFFLDGDKYKFNIIIPKKSSTNVFPLDFSSENLKFYYQPPLTEEFKDGWSDEFQTDIKVTETQVTGIIDGKEVVLVERPEEVVGSYAVYHATKGNIHPAGEAEKYKTGKAFHWYRPLIFDADGNKTWGVLNVESGLRTVTVPWEFLNNAVYPVTIDDTFGYEGSGGTNYSAPDYLFTSYVTYSPTLDGSATSMSVLCKDSGEAFKLGLYDSSDNSFVAGTNAGAAPAAKDWATANFASAVDVYSAKNYYLISWWDTYTTFYGDAGDGTKAKRDSESYGNPWPSPASWTDYIVSAIFSIYCTYTAGGGGWANIAKINGVTSATMLKVNGVAIANIAKVSGVAV